MRRGRGLALVLAVGVALSACAPKVPPATVAGAPRFPDFIFPAAPQAASPEIVSQHQFAWQLVQMADLRGAEREFNAILKQTPTFYPAETGLGYAALADKDHKAALAHFDKAISLEKAYAPAHAGRGQTLLAMNDAEKALASFDAALAADPSLATIRSVADVLRFKGLQGNVAAARQAAEAGRLADATAAYRKAIAATPDSPFLYRELAMVERRDNRLADALLHAQKAVELDPSDARNHVVLADVLESQGQFAKAAEAVAAGLALEPNDALTRRVEALRERAALETMPDEYRAIDKSSTITRAQLAALIGVQLEEIVTRGSSQSGAVMTDIRSNWAQPWILSVTRAGFMEPYANHAFQPNATVTRGDLAFTVSRILNAIAVTRPQLAAGWRNARPKFTDVPPGHLRYPAVALAVGAGVMASTGEGSFQLARPVTGAEAVSAIRKLQDLAGSRRR
jgi:tetratricopeptide (TPR) repeat protein